MRHRSFLSKGGQSARISAALHVGFRNPGDSTASHPQSKERRPYTGPAKVAITGFAELNGALTSYAAFR